MTSDDLTTDAEVFAALRRTWLNVDPVPVDLADRMIATLAAADLGTEYALLTMVDSDAVGAVRGDADMFTLQFSDGTTSVLLHVTPAARGRSRIDGWIDAPSVEVCLVQGEREQFADADGGRFSFASVAPGISRLRIRFAEPDGTTELLTPRFEL